MFLCLQYNSILVMLLYYLITCVSFILFLKSLALKPLPLWAYDMRLLSLCFWKDLPFFSITRLIKKACLVSSMKRKPNKSNVDDKDLDLDTGMSILDLPDLALECILQKLPPAELCRMTTVCTSLRDWCISDHLWEGHMKSKWDRLIGPAAHREWKWHIASLKEDSTNLRTPKGFGFMMRLLSFVWPFRSSSPLPSMVEGNNKTYLPLDSTLSWYLALETGKFWFPAQVYNRENGHVGFMLSCYDAELSYDSRTDSFQARYPPHGKRAVAIESGVSWERLRAPPTDTPAHHLHISDCLNELRPGDHIEIQWRRNKEFPYGWWYGVVGHLESCDGNANYCLCHNSDSVTLEFNQYATGSRWRCMTINRKDHREEGNEAAGFYGGIRKLKNDYEISTWKLLWPAEVLD